MSAVFYVEQQTPGLDRRVFRRAACGALEWAHFSDWQTSGSMARFYGFANRDLPPGCVEVAI